MRIHAELLIMLALALGGCAGLTPAAARVDQVSFDRGGFALGYAGLVNPMLVRCSLTAGPTQTPACVELITLDAQVRQAILDAPKAAAATPPQADPLSALLPLIMKLAPLAGGL